MIDNTLPSAEFFPREDSHYQLKIVCIDFGPTLNNIRRFNVESQKLQDSGGIDPARFIDGFLIDMPVGDNPFSTIPMYISRYTNKVHTSERDAFIFELKLALHKLLEGLLFVTPNRAHGYRVHQSVGAGQFLYIADAWGSEIVDPMSPEFNKYIPL